MLQKTLKLAGSTLLATAIVITSSASAFAYEVKPGDTLSKIARENGTTVEAIMKANNITDPNVIFVGQNLSVGNDNYVNKSLSSSDRALLKRMFDAKWYAANYPDVVKLLGNREDVLFEHFCTYGLFETRQLNADFNVNAYATGYGDLHKAFGNNIMEYYKHYESFGKKEKRDCTTIEKCLEKVGYVKSVSPLNSKGTDEKLFDTILVKKEEEHTESEAPVDTVRHIEEVVPIYVNLVKDIYKDIIENFVKEEKKEELLQRVDSLSFQEMTGFYSDPIKLNIDEANKDAADDYRDTKEDEANNYLSYMDETVEIKEIMNSFLSLQLLTVEEWGVENEILTETKEEYIAREGITNPKAAESAWRSKLIDDVLPSYMSANGEKVSQFNAYCVQIATGLNEAAAQMIMEKRIYDLTGIPISSN